MASFELNSLFLAANSTTASTGSAAGAVSGTDAQPVPPSPFFSQLLQKSDSGNLVAVAADELATAQAAGSSRGVPIVGNQGASHADLALPDPTGIGKAGMDLQAAVSALAGGMVLAADQGETGKAEKPVTESAGDHADTVDTTDGTALLPKEWLGLPLCVESRAALQGVVSTETTPASAPAVAVGAESKMEVIGAQVMLRSALASAHVGAGEVRSESSVAGSASHERSGNGTGALLMAAAGGAQPIASGTSAELLQAVTGRRSPMDSGLVVPTTGAAVVPAGVDAIALAAVKLKVNAPANGSPVMVEPPALETAVEGLTTPAAGVPVPGIVTASTSKTEKMVAVGPLNGTITRVATPEVGSLAAASAKIATVAIAAAERENAAKEAGVATEVQLSRFGLAESFVQIEPALESGRVASAVRISSAGTLQAAMVIAGANQPTPSANQELLSLVATQAHHRAADESVTADAVQRQGTLGDVAAGSRAVDAPAPVSAGTAAPANTSSTAPLRLDTGTSSAFPPTTPDVLDLRRENWGRTLGHQLNWMVDNRLQEAEIRVNPPDLGPVEVRVSLHHNQTNVTFFCHEAAVREVIENALPQLREMLNSQGMALNQAHVSNQSLAQQQQAGSEGQPYEQRDGLPTTPALEAVTDAEPQSRPRRLLGMVDHYV